MLDKDWSACCYLAKILPSHEQQHVQLWVANVDVWSKNANNHKKNRIGNARAMMIELPEQPTQTFSNNAAVLYCWHVVRLHSQFDYRTANIPRQATLSGTVHCFPIK